MKLCTFLLETSVGQMQRIGVVDSELIIDATSARIAFLEESLSVSAAFRVGNAQVPPDMIDFIGAGCVALDWLREAIRFVQLQGKNHTRGGVTIKYTKESVRLQAPIPRPPGIACFVTWSAHVDDSREKGFSMLNFPSRDSDLRAYYKANPDAIEGPGTYIPRPAYAEETDVECEMAAIVGVGGKDLSLAQAREAIFGYSIFNDVSYRGIQRQEMAFGLGPTKGKDADHSNVLGPWLVTADEVNDPQNLEMSFSINGKKISSYHTSKMAWDFADLVSYLSRSQTLKPGQIVTSGSFPGGSGLDANIKIKSGDVVEMQIEKLGSLVSFIA